MLPNTKSDRMEPELFPLGDTAIVIQFGSSIDQNSNRKVRALTTYLEQNPFPGLIEFVPAFISLTIFYDPMKLRDPLTRAHCKIDRDGGFQAPYEVISGMMDRILMELDTSYESASSVVQIPVCYGGELGPDLKHVAEYHGITPEEVIDIHSSKDYLVYMIGFAPGFPYLGGMPERIATPRRSSPRLAIEPGSVGIGGSQTGIYPISTPGGWHLIGKTPLQLFRPNHRVPSLLKAGDIVRFQPIELRAYQAWRED